MKTINTSLIRDAVEKMCIESCCIITNDILETYLTALKNEKSELGREILEQLIQNAQIASSEGIPVCQDTGMTVVFVEIGNEVQLTGEPIGKAINSGVRNGYEKGYLRKSVVNHPLERVNTKDNTPAVIHYDFIDGDNIKISVMPKGFGSENMSALAMLKPSDGIDGVIDFVVKTIDNAGPNACPPFFVGIGIGGTAEKAMIIAKKSLLRKPGKRSEVHLDELLELEILKKANNLGIGPAGLGGNITVFDVFVESFPTHIAGLPVAVNICCHSLRHR
ncbi:MAG: fumarate hydratase, partial [Clostridiales bacterium]|nr:fumarate hydratase [Clostridiales bacterium]